MTFFYDLNKRLAAIGGKKALTESRLAPDYVSDRSDMVRFEVYGDEAVDALNDMLGHVIEWDDEDMMVIPREYMPEVQEIVDELGGELVMNECGAAPGVTPEHLDELSKDTLKSYVKKAADDTWHQGRKFQQAKDAGDQQGKRDANRRDWNHRQGIDRAMDRLEEATVRTKKYSWGTMKVIDQGADFSIILHPELIDAITALSDGGHTVIRDETGTQYGVTREGEQLHFVNPRAGVDVVVDRSEICDDEQLDELSKDTLKSYGKKAAGEIRGKTMQHGRALDTYGKANSEKKAAALRPGVDNAARKLKNREAGVQRAFDRLEEQQIDEISDELVNRTTDARLAAVKSADRSNRDELMSKYDKFRKNQRLSTNRDVRQQKGGKKPDPRSSEYQNAEPGRRYFGDSVELDEGTWSTPDTPDKQAKLLKILSAPLNAEAATHVLYNYLGNDDLFDRLGDEAEYYGREDIPVERQDVRQLVVRWLQKNADQFPEYQEVLDQLDGDLLTELSKDTLGSYIKKAARDAISKSDRAGMKVGFGHGGAADDYIKASKREQGIHRATDRLTNEDAEIDDLVSNLRKAYAGIDRVDPASPVYKKLIAFLDGLDQEHLQVLADAGIKFVSMLAKTRLLRKGVEECGMNESDWNYETPKSKRGMFKGKSKADLQKQYNALKKSGPHEEGSAANTKMKQLAFALRAKSDWGKVKEDEVSERAGPVNKKDWQGYYRSGKTHNDKTWGDQLHLGERAGPVHGVKTWQRSWDHTNESAGDVDLEAWMDEYDDNEAHNYHTENVLKVAELVGSPKDVEIVKKIMAERDRMGGLNQELYNVLSNINQRLFPKVKQLYTEWRRGHTVHEAAKPDYIDADGDGDKKEPMKKAFKDKAQLDELSKDTLSSYVDKARSSREREETATNTASDYDTAAKHNRKYGNRVQGVSRAFDRLTNEEQLDELSKDTLKSYAKKASKDRGWQGVEAGASGSGSPEQKAAVGKMKKRQQGVERAVDRLANEGDMSGVLDAARNYNKSFIVTAKTAEGATKKFRVKAQSERVAREKFSQHHNQAKILSVQEENLNELSKDTLKSYSDKAGKDKKKSWDLANAAAQRSNKGRKSDMDQFMKHSERFGKRSAGLDRAASRLSESKNKRKKDGK